MNNIFPYEIPYENRLGITTEKCSAVIPNRVSYDDVLYLTAEKSFISQGVSSKLEIVLQRQMLLNQSMLHWIFISFFEIMVTNEHLF